MNILIVNTVPTERNGISGVIFNYLESLLLEKGDTLGFVSINEPNQSLKNRLDILGATRYIIDRSIKNPVGYIFKLKQIAKGYDIIHVHGNSATMLLEMISAKLGVVPVRIAHGHTTSCTMRWCDCICRPLFYALCNSRVACGDAAGRWLFRKRPFKVLHNGVNTREFKFNSETRERMLQSLSIADSNAVFGHIGNFVEAKNHPFLIDVFKAIIQRKPDSKLLLLGSGNGMAEIKEKVESLGLVDNVIFAGSVDNPEEYMSAMDVVIMPSLFEGLPLTLVEEQANGLSCLVSDAITSEADMTGNLSFLPLSASVEEWASKAVSIAEDAVADRSEKSAEAIRRIKERGYDISSNAEDLKNFYIAELSKYK